MSTEQLFEAALGVAEPRPIKAVAFDEGSSVLTIRVDFQRGARFATSRPRGCIRSMTPPPGAIATSTSSSTR